MTSELYDRIARFYDASSALWENIWGEHMHHGYYGRAGGYRIDRRQAQIDLIEELLHWARVTSAESIIDLGCGIGGSTLYLADKYNASAVGVTLSPKQAARATERAREANLEDRVSFQVADAQNVPYPDDSFDLVWSLESGEHMPDKIKFLRECYRVLKPGGKLIFVTWCHRATDSVAGELTPREKNLLREIYRVYCLPYVISLPQYENIATDCGFKDIITDDWSTAVAPFWDRVITSALDFKAIGGLLNSGWTTVEAALSLGLMREGYESGLIRFGLLRATK